jgi:hypothetical protein
MSKNALYEFIISRIRTNSNSLNRLDFVLFDSFVPGNTTRARVQLAAKVGSYYRANND